MAESLSFDRASLQKYAQAQVILRQLEPSLVCDLARLRADSVAVMQPQLALVGRADLETLATAGLLIKTSLPTKKHPNGASFEPTETFLLLVRQASLATTRIARRHLGELQEYILTIRDLTIPPT